MNMLSTIEPKSNQLNSDDLIGRTMTITVTKVELLGGEQPVAVHFQGDNGKPYKPGKSMRRVMVSVWGPDANNYVGQAMTIYRDEKVQFGGMDVGGIRISHMTGLKGDKTIALTATRGNKQAFVVKPLKVTPAAQPAAPASAAATSRKSVRDIVRERIAEARDPSDLLAITTLPEYQTAMQKAPDEVKNELQKMLHDAHDALQGEPDAQNRDDAPDAGQGGDAAWDATREGGVG